MMKIRQIMILILFGTTVSFCQNSKLHSVSRSALYVNILKGDQVLSRATGFLIEWKNRPYFITNWHVITGRHPLDPPDYSGRSTPDRIKIIYPAKIDGYWIKKSTELLYDTLGNQRWYEHPKKWVDIVAIPLTNYDTSIVDLKFLDLNTESKSIKPEIGMLVHIVGFVEGLTGPGVLPIWKSGHIASEPSLGYKGNSAFLIDATTRPGMSGSPVIMKDGNSSFIFLGIYSGRLSSESEIGLVWKPDNILELLESISN